MFKRVGSSSYTSSMVGNNQLSASGFAAHYRTRGKKNTQMQRFQQQHPTLMKTPHSNATHQQGSGSSMVQSSRRSQEATARRNTPNTVKRDTQHWSKQPQVASNTPTLKQVTVTRRSSVIMSRGDSNVNSSAQAQPHPPRITRFHRISMALENLYRVMGLSDTRGDKKNMHTWTRLSERNQGSLVNGPSMVNTNTPPRHHTLIDSHRPFLSSNTLPAVAHTHSQTQLSSHSQEPTVRFFRAAFATLKHDNPYLKVDEEEYNNDRDLVNPAEMFPPHRDEMTGRYIKRPYTKQIDMSLQQQVQERMKHVEEEHFEKLLKQNSADRQHRVRRPQHNHRSGRGRGGGLDGFDGIKGNY